MDLSKKLSRMMKCLEIQDSKLLVKVVRNQFKKRKQLKLAKNKAAVKYTKIQFWVVFNYQMKFH